MLEAIVFDFDGLIIDSEIAVAGAWQEVFESRGFEFPEGLWREMVGTRDNDGLLWAELERLTAERFDPVVFDPPRKARGLELSQELQPLPGVVELMHAARERGVRLAVASSSSDWWVRGHLERLGLTELMDSIATKNDGVASKPDPAIYRLTMERLGIASAHGVALEDTQHGVSAAKAAGLLAVAVPGSYTEHMRFDHADVLLRSVADKPATALLDEFEVRLTGRAV